MSKMQATTVVCLLILSSSLEAQAIHTAGRCDSRYQDLLQQAALIHHECGEPTVYNCCSLATFYNILHTQSPMINIHQVKSSCKSSDTHFGKTIGFARCDMISDNGGWTVIFRRDTSVPRINRVDFNRNWNDYENGFGDLETEFWYGLKEMHCLTQANVEMRIDITFTDRTSIYWTYGKFIIDGADEKYKLHIGQAVGSTGAGTQDAITSHIVAEGNPFTTKDRDNDRSLSNNCAISLHGGWWYQSCTNARLTASTMYWNTPTSRTVSLVEMKIRPKVCNA